MSPKSSLHIAIIPDGNRRWARAQMLRPWKGHEKAVDNFRTLIDWCRESGRVKILTVWCFSTENWKRDPEEIAKLMKMLEDFLIRERQDFIKHKTRFVHSGRKDRIPPSLASIIREVEEETTDMPDFVLNLAVDYGGKNEIIRAIHTLRNTADITEESLREHLDHPDLPDIDLIVRTSGEQRTSNFFLWQSAYAEWMFTPKYFPDFSAKDLENAVNEFEGRKRRFGS